jgi:hypothetical protein
MPAALSGSQTAAARAGCASSLRLVAVDTRGSTFVLCSPAGAAQVRPMRTERYRQVADAVHRLLRRWAVGRGGRGLVEC